MTRTTGKMTLTIDSAVYSQLLSQYQPRIIKTEQENEEFLGIVEELLSRKHLNPEEKTLLELLVKLIEDFEDKNYQLNCSTPRSRLIHLMEAQNLTEVALVDIFGSSENANKVLSGDLQINLQQALALGKMLHVDYSLFLDE